MKYAFIERHRHAWPVSVQCRVLQVGAAGCRKHLVRRASSTPRRHLSDEALLVHIKALHAETRGAYGWPRIWRELVARGIAVAPGVRIVAASDSSVVNCPTASFDDPNTAFTSLSRIQRASTV